MQTFNEQWRPIKGYEGIYVVSNLGNIRSVKKKIYRKQRLERYKRAELSKNGIRKVYLVHRLVAIAFVDNPDNKKQVNHKDGNKHNNISINLEWCSHSENMQHAHQQGYYKKSILQKGHPVKQYDKKGNFVKEYLSAMDAERATNIPNANINKCLKNKRFSAGGYIWKSTTPLFNINK